MTMKRVLRVKCYARSYLAVIGVREVYASSVTAGIKQRTYYSTAPYQSKARAWNEIVLDAERLVGYEEFNGVTVSLDGSHAHEKGSKEDIQSILEKLRGLVAFDSPLLNIARNFEPSSKDKATSQVRGLVVLLMAKLASGQSTNKQYDNSECDSFGLTPKQRLLAQIIEMTYAARLIHRTVTNLQSQQNPDVDTPQSNKLVFNNKVAVLMGDYLLARATLNLGLLRNTKVLEMMSGIIRNFAEVDFMFRQDKQGNAYPTPATNARDWEVRAYMSFASIYSNGCRSMLLLSAEDEIPQLRAFEFGKQLGLVWQIHNEIQPFINSQETNDTSAFDLMSIPMIMQMQSDPSILTEVLPHHNFLDNVNYAKIRSIIKGGTALKESVDLQHKYAEDTVRILNQFKDSECRRLLKEIISHLSAF